jgi:hypothetical protein
VIGSGGYGDTGGAIATGGYSGSGGYWGGGGYWGTGGYYCPPYGGAGGFGYADAGAPSDAGSADGGIPSPDPCAPPLPPDPLRDDLAKAYCGAGDRCCKPDDPFAFGRGPFCPYYLGQNLTSILGQMRASQAAGRSTIDEAALKACVQSLQTAACKDIASLLVAPSLNAVPGCPRVTMGKVAEGDGCDRDFECLDGLYCDGSICRARPTSGQPCPDGACASGLYCRTFNPSARCVPKEPDGRLCDGPDECACGTCAFSAQYFTTLCGAPTSCTGQ